MPTQNYALIRGEEKKLSFSWEFGWNHLYIEYDGIEVGHIENRKALQAGQTFTLPDKSKLDVKLQNSIFSSGLILTRNGAPVPDSMKDPRTALKENWIIALIVAIYNIVLGFLFVVLKIDTPFLQYFGYITSAFGVGYLVLSQLLRRYSLPALIAFLVLFGLETLLEAATNYSLFVLLRAGLMYYMLQGFGALKKLKEEESEHIPMISE